MVKFMDSNKKLLISIIAFIVVLGIGVGILFFLGREKTPGQSGQNGEFFSNLQYVDSEKMTSADMPDSPAMDNMQMSPSEMAVMEAFVSGTYYISMVDLSSSEQTEISMAINGENFQMGFEINGIKLDCMLLNDNIYFITKNKKFVDLNSLMSMAGETEEFDTSGMKEIASMLDVTKYNFTSYQKTDVMLGETQAVCYTYFSDDVNLSFYFAAGELRKISLASTSGSDAFEIEVKAFQTTIPSGMLTLIGLKKANIIDFMTEMGLTLE